MSSLAKFQNSLIEFKCVPSFILDMFLTDDKFWAGRVENHKYSTDDKKK
jgi:hypothetical protein